MKISKMIGRKFIYYFYHKNDLIFATFAISKYNGCIHYKEYNCNTFTAITNNGYITNSIEVVFSDVDKLAKTYEKQRAPK